MMKNRWEDWFQPGETLIWQGAPEPGIRSFPRNLLLTIIGLPFLGMGLVAVNDGLGRIFSFDGAGNALAGLIIVLFGGIFSAVGVAAVFGTWLEDHLKPKRVRYALTDHNAYIATRYLQRNMEVFPLNAGSRIEVDHHSDGTGSVFFDFQEYVDDDGQREIRKRGFEAILDADRVYDLIRLHQSKVTQDDI